MSFYTTILKYSFYLSELQMGITKKSMCTTKPLFQKVVCANV